MRDVALRYALIGAVLVTVPAFASPKSAEAPLATPPGITLQAVRLGGGGMGAATTVLADAKGKTAYTSDSDKLGASSCNDACAKEWPPLLAAAGANATGDWTFIARADGGRQWAYKDKPLYTSVKDEAIGEGKGAQSGWRLAAFQPSAGVALPPGLKVLELANATGQALVDEQTMPLYTFDADAGAGKPTCVGLPCSAAWRPFEAAQLSRPMGAFTVVRRGDGLFQWAYKGLPLYSYVGDMVSGDAKGDGIDGAWHTALLTRYFMPAGIAVRNNHFGGSHLTDVQGLTLYVRDRVVGAQQGRSYRFGAHVNPAVGRLLGISTCDAACAQTWHPMKAPQDAMPSGYWDVIAREDGQKQWVYRGFPLYTYVGDKKPGDMTGVDTYEIMEGDDPFKAADIGMKGAGAMVWHAVAP